MSFAVLIYDLLVRLAVSSFLVSVAATIAVLVIREPARRIRAIQWSLAGLVVLPGLLLLPGYPRLAVLPAASHTDEALDDAAPESATNLLPPAVLAAEPASDTVVTMPTLPPVELPSATLAPQVGQTPVFAEPTRVPIDTQPIETITAPQFAVEQPASAVTTFDAASAPEPVVVPETPIAATVIAPAETAPLASDAAWQPTLPKNYRIWLVAAYGTGVLIMAAWSILGLAAVARLMRTVRPAPIECRILLRSLGGSASDRVAVVVSPRVMQPCALWWRKTTIVLPESLVAESDPQALRWALAHEWSHVERGDLAAWNSSALVRCCYFYQPLVWWLRGQLQLCQDFVADAAAARLGDLPEDYAEFLTTSSFTRPTLAAGLGIGGRISDLQRRVIMLVERRRPLESKSPRAWNYFGLPIAVTLVAMIAALAPQNRLEADNRLEAGAGRLEEEEEQGAAEPAEEAAAAEKPVKADAAQPADPAPVEVPAAEAPVGPVDAAAPVDPVEPVAPSEFAVPAVPATAPAVVESEIVPRVPTTKPATAPQGPRKIKPADMLMLSVQDNFQSLNQPGLQLLVPSGETLEVDEEGRISFGSAYGSVPVGGKSLREAEKLIGDALLDEAKESAKQALANREALKESFEYFGHQMQINVRLRFLTPMAVTPYPVSGTFEPTSPTPRRSPLLGSAARAATAAPTAKPTPAAVPTTAVPVPRQAVPATAPAPGPTVAPYVNVLQQPIPATSAVADDGTIQPGDLLSIELMPEEANKLVKHLSVVEPDGKLALGVTFGRIHVAGKSLSDAEELVQARVRGQFQNPKVQITHADATNVPQGVGVPAGLTTQGDEVKELQQEIEQLKSTIRDLKKEAEETKAPLKQPTFQPLQQKSPVQQLQNGIPVSY